MEGRLVVDTDIELGSSSCSCSSCSRRFHRHIVSSVIVVVVCLHISIINRTGIDVHGRIVLAVMRLGRRPLDLEEVEILIGADEIVVPSPHASLLEAAFLTIFILLTQSLVKATRLLAAGLGGGLGGGFGVGLGAATDAAGPFAARPGRENILPSRRLLGRCRNVVSILGLVGRLLGGVAHVSERIALKSIGLHGTNVWMWCDKRIRVRDDTMMSTET